MESIQLREAETQYATTGYFALEWEVSAERVRQWCAQGRIPGAKRLIYGSREIWHVPISSARPKDRRSGRIISQIPL